MKQRKPLPIDCWAREDIPTCKAQDKGYKSLTTAELLSIIIGSGTMSENAVELSRRLLVENDNSLKKLASMRMNDMTAINGIGDIKASKVFAALELANRMNMERAKEREYITTATEVYNYMAPRIAMLENEEFWMIYLNQSCRLLQAKRISCGGLSETPVDIRIIIRDAVLCNATTVIACHNHPSGNTRPSRYDDEVTQAIKNACHTMRLHLLDHLIVVDGQYYSYKEEGKL